MAGDGETDGYSLPPKGMASSCSGIAALTGLYVAGLVAIVVAGTLSPDLFVIKTASLGTSSGTTSASSDFIFDTSDYRPAHQSLSLALRTNIPAALQNVINGHEGDSLVAIEHLNITVYGSPQETLVSASCPTGCSFCPNGDESIGLTCSLMEDAHSRTEEVTCEGGEDWCSWVPIYDVNFLKYTTYYWTIETTSELDSLVEDTDIDTAWEYEFRVIFGSPSWTAFAIVWYYSWAGFALMAMFAPGVGFFTIALTEGVRWAEWTRWQKWSGVLLIGLFFFDNPLFAVEVHTTAARGFFLSSAVLSGLFTALLFMSWLDLLFILGRSRDPSGYEKEGLARAAMWGLTLLLFVDYTLVMIELRFSHDGDPRHVHEYPKTYNAMEQFLAVLVFVLCGWVVVLSCRAWWNGRARDLLVSGSSPRPKFLTGTSVATLLILLPSTLLELSSPRVRGGFSFCLVHGATNLYVISLALCTPPSKDIGDDPLGDGFGARNGAGRAAGVGEEFGTDTAAAPRTPEDGEEFDPSEERRTASGNWWKGNARPKVADSSVWENATSASVL